MLPLRLATIPILLLLALALCEYRNIGIRSKQSHAQSAQEASWKQAIEDLDHVDWLKRVQASRYLVENSEDWILILPGNYSHSSLEARWRFGKVLDTIHELNSIPELASAQPLDQLMWQVQRLNREYPKSVQRLIAKLVKDRRARVRVRAIELSVLLTNDVRKKMLSKLRHDSSSWVRKNFYSRAWEIDAKWSQSIIRSEFTRPGVSSQDLVGLIEAIAERPAIEDAALVRNSFVKNSDPAVKHSAAIALLSFQLKQDGESRAFLLREGEYPQIIQVLNRLSAPLSSAESHALVELLNSSLFELRARALQAISSYGERSIAPMLIPFLEDEDEELARAVGNLVIKLGAKKHFQNLRDAQLKRPTLKFDFSITAAKPKKP